MLKNTDQRGNKDDRAQYFQEEERQNLDRSYRQRRSLSLRWQIRAVFQNFEKPLRIKANIRSSGRTASNTG